MSAAPEFTPLDFPEDRVRHILVHTFGELPPLRADTPLAALGFQPAHAVILVHQAELAGLSFPRSIDFARIVTVGDFAAACETGGVVLAGDLGG